MGQDLEGPERDNTDATMARGDQSDEVVTDVVNVSNITKMGDGINMQKMENVKNSTKNGHKSEVR